MIVFLNEGIVAVGNGFLVALFATGGLYYVEPENGVSAKVIPLGDLQLADGLELVAEEDGAHTLYISEGGANAVSVWRAEEGDPVPRVIPVGKIESDLYDSPATSAVVGDKVYTANLRLGTIGIRAENEEDLVVFNETFGLVGMYRFVAANESKDPGATDTPDGTDAAGGTDAPDGTDTTDGTFSTTATWLASPAFLAGMLLVPFAMN